jgi:hypothetical protein
MVLLHWYRLWARFVSRTFEWRIWRSWSTMLFYRYWSIWHFWDLIVRLRRTTQSVTWTAHTSSLTDAQVAAIVQMTIASFCSICGWSILNTSQKENTTDTTNCKYSYEVKRAFHCNFHQYMVGILLLWISILPISILRSYNQPESQENSIWKYSCLMP